MNLIQQDITELVPILLDELRRRNLHLATAESCTGGNIAHCITLVPGCSDVFYGAVVSYANSAKINVLGVPAEAIAANGAVSEPVVRAMAEGACHRLSTECAVAVSGIAGPDGGTPEKPVGTIWIAATTPGGTHAELYRNIIGTRAEIIDKATLLALKLLYNQL